VFDVQDGRILTWSLEAHVVDHCNLRCRHCCSLSPQVPKRTTPVVQLARDLRAVRRAVKPQIFKITGGEPLLHPDLAGCLQAVRDSEIADTIQMTTNGHLVRRMPEEAWALLDRLVVSRYTSAPLAEKLLSVIRARCDEHGVDLIVKEIDSFAEMDVAPPGHDDEARRQIYEDCWLRIRCHMIYEGTFYKCTRPPHIEDVLRAGNSDAPPLAASDGVSLDGKRLAQRIKAYLEADETLDSCRFCMGASGAQRPHVQVKPQR
jgi:GTP 3',8-cyclase